MNELGTESPIIFWILARMLDSATIHERIINIKRIIKASIKAAHQTNSDDIISNIWADAFAVAYIYALVEDKDIIDKILPIAPKVLSFLNNACFSRSAGIVFMALRE